MSISPLSSQRFPVPQTSQTPPDSEQQASVLIVDDEKALRLVLRRAMTGEGYQTIDASSGESCLFLCRQQRPDIILLDAVMPGMDGFECCRHLKAMFSDRCPPILMITTLYDQESVDKAFSVGATDFVTKPIHWAILRQRVRRLLETDKLVSYWQVALQREQALQHQLETADRKVAYLTELCKTKGIEIPS
ncbi:response regulator [Leptolyngbya ohadii]|uniref:response regulator n=1 Tax=Leptolyngbya ohadii TaxID=1962290 RepID=UPI000B5A156F|nr:response regulator [Leptolyngbya ohadii]